MKEVGWQLPFKKLEMIEIYLNSEMYLILNHKLITDFKYVI